MLKRGVEPPGVIFELQWRQTGELSSKIGIWDIDCKNLKLDLFKSYLAQSLGTGDDLNISYVDSDGDDLPIDSECEFQEALKFARRRSKRGAEIVLKLDKITNGPVNAGSDKTSNQAAKTKCEKPAPKLKTGKPGRGQAHVKTPKPKPEPPAQGPLSPLCLICGNVDSYNYYYYDTTKDLKSNLKNVTKFVEGGESEDETPKWFKRSMKKMRAMLLDEVKSTIKQSMAEAIKQERFSLTPQHKEESKVSAQQVSHVYTVKMKKKKKSSDEDSAGSDGAFLNDQRDMKLLKKIEKLHRRGERKFEKLDSKLEKLENKTKRLLEKKSQSKSRSEKQDKAAECPVEEGRGRGKAKKSCKSDIPMSTCLMNAMLLLEPCRTVRIEPGQQFLKVWHVANNGTLPWTDKTELCLSWGTPGLRFDKQVIKCPPLEPGEEGTISVYVEAPNYPGTFESYWHFHHMGARFGHWIDCAVIVGLHAPSPHRSLHQACENTISAFYNKKEMEEKVLEMAELTQELFDIQMQTYKENTAKQEEGESDTAPWSHPSNTSSEMMENQRKIAANMVEIQKRLDDLSLLHNPPTADKILEMAFGPELEEMNVNLCGKKDEEELDQEDMIDLNHITGKNIEPAEWMTLQAHPEFLKRLPEFLRPRSQDEDGNDNLCCTLKRDHHQQKCDPVASDEDNNLDKQSSTEPHLIQGEPNIVTVDEDSPAENVTEGKVAEIDSESDSELSVISNFSSLSESEDDELNFLMVGMPNGQSDCQSYHSTENDETTAATADPKDAEVQGGGTEEVVVQEESINTAEEAKEEEQKQEEKISQEIRCKDSLGRDIYAVHTNGNCFPVKSLLTNDFNVEPCQSAGPTLRRSRHCEYETKSKKMKSSSPGEPPRRDTKYNFKASQLRDCPWQDIHVSSGTPFTFTGNGCYCHCGRKDERRRSEKPKAGAKAIGAATYPAMRPRMRPPKRDEQPVDLLPNSLMHGAINVASSAINTARSVFTNLQTAFAIPDQLPGERGTAASSEALFRLYEMGFTDIRMNTMLLENNDNDVMMVVEELVWMQEAEEAKRQRRTP